MISIALAIPHTPWVAARVESFRGLLRGLYLSRSLQWVDGETRSTGPFTARSFTDRAPNWDWSEQMWRWGTETDCSHFLQLQDDVIVAPNFWPALRAMVEAVPDQVICLETVHPAATALALEGHRWFTTSDGLVGVGYVMPRTMLAEFLEWRSTALREGGIEAITEDTLIGVWCLVTGRRVWHPLPTIIDHDTTLESTYGNDDHANRRPLVRWDTSPEPIEHAQNWRQGKASVHIGRLYEASPVIAANWVKGATQDDVQRWRADDGRDVKRRLSAQARVRQIDDTEHARIFLCTPVHGRPSPYYTSSVWDLIGNTMLDVRASFDVERAEQMDNDVMRTRSRFVRKFLATDCTHLLFVDADIAFKPVVVRGMLAAKKDFVAAPYPRRDHVDWKSAREGGEASAYGYRVRFLENFTGNLDVGSDGCAEVAALGLGCALLSREMLQRMTDGWRSLTVDEDDGTELVALFWIPLKNRRMPSEDYAFCERWREMDGGKVWMYLGPGSPVTHHGDWAFTGHIESFGLRHA